MEDAEALRVVGYLLDWHPTIGAFARDEHGNQCLKLDGSACCWCLAGACFLVAKVCQGREMLDMRLLRAAAARLGLPVRVDPMAALTTKWDRAGDDAQFEMVERLKTTGL